MMKIWTYGSTLVLSLALLTGAASADLLIDEPFTYDDDTQLNGTTSPGTANAQWTAARARDASKGFYISDNVLQAGMFGNSSVGGADLGVGFFADNPGIYTLSTDAFFSTNFASRSWQMGFSVITSNNGGINRNLLSTDSNKGLGGSPVLALTKSGALLFKRDRNDDNATTIASAGTFPAGTAYNLKLILNTSTPQWTVDAFVDDVPLDVSGDPGDGTDTYTYPVGENPDNIRYAAIGTNIQPADTTVDDMAYLDNFTLEFAVPEPTTLGLLIAGALPMLRRRR